MTLKLSIQFFCITLLKISQSFATYFMDQEQDPKSAYCLLNKIASSSVRQRCYRRYDYILRTI